MKNLLAIILTLILSSVIFTQAPQENPLSQAEYVKMLYGLDTNPASKEDLISAIRTRGLGFTLTRGLRSLTISKSKNDAELRRTLEEAGRRRENPTAAKLPSAAEGKLLIDRARQNTLEAAAEMPDFVVKQRIQRSAAYAGTNNFRNRDRLVVAVSYLSKGQEEYKVLSINGVVQDKPQTKNDYSEVKGTSSTGEFVSVLKKVFERDSETKFELVDTDTIRDRRAVVFDYSIVKDKAKQLLTSQGYTTDSTITGVKGRIWIDRKDFRVLRLENIATEIPANFPIRSAQRIIDYDWVKINEETFLLPSLSDVRLTVLQGKNLFESRNLIHFKDYKKYGSEVIILDDDDEDIVDDTTREKPAEEKPEEDPEP